MATGPIRVAHTFDIRSVSRIDSRNHVEDDLPRTPPFHAWVDSSGQFGLNSGPGLLLAWRRRPESGLKIRKESEWQCLVISARTTTPANREGLWVYQHWMNPAHVRPIAAEKPSMQQRKRHTKQASSRRVLPIHAWVDSSGQFGLKSDPGLVLAWRRTPESGPGTGRESGWQCLVISASEPAPASTQDLWVYQRWMNPEHVWPVDAEKPSAGRSKPRWRAA